MPGLSKWLIGVWAVAFAILILDTVVSIYNIDVLVANDNDVAHSREINRATSRLLLALLDAETGQRGYIISGRNDFLEPYHQGEKLIPKYLQELERLTAGDEFYESRFGTLRQLIEGRMAILGRTIRIHEPGHADESREEIRKGEGKDLMDRIRREIAAMENHEQQILDRRSDTATKHYRSATFAALVGGILTLLMVAMAFVLVRVEFARRQKAEVESQQAALQLADEQRRQSEVLARMVQIRTAELESANQLLREEIAERTRAEGRAQTATIELTRSNEELEKFAYVASHDLQEPLRKIQAFGDRLVNKFRDSLGPNGAEYIDRMQAAATRMRTLINDLLSFSRVTTKGQPFSPVDLNTIVSEVVDDLGDAIERTAAQVDVGDLPSIQADPLQMRQLFQNLIANALKFHRPNVAPSVSIRAIAWDHLPPGSDPLSPSGTGFRIIVADNGIGFDQSFAERVFELFQRLHGRGEYEGTGIGLAICRKIVQRHGGAIIARSRENDGAEFVIDLPASASE